MPRPDLVEIQNTIVALAIEAIAEFARSHRTESFYAFGFDCNAEYGDVLLCLNTEEDFQQTAEKYVAQWNYGPEELSSLKRNFGDWKYQGFNLEQQRWNDGWAPYRAMIREYVSAELIDVNDEDALLRERERFVEELLRCICRALILVERSQVLDKLTKDPGFFTQVVDHDEDEDAAAERLHAVRNEFSP